MSNAFETWSVTAASNLTIGGVSIAEGTAAANLNNGIRAVIAEAAMLVAASTGSKISGGSANAQTLSTGMGITAVAVNQRFTFKAGSSNTAGATIAIDSLAAKSILRQDGSALAAGDIISGGVYDIAYVAAGNFRLLNPSAISSTGVAVALSGTAIPAGGTAGSGYMFSSTANFGVFFGSGAPTLAAAKGSLYLRSDGSGITDRMYVNSNGSTTWVAVTTTA